ncbi:hypothetical protein [Streptomyces sp. PSKA30]|uniref:hypothetical protein n=1 Tax=Streptomyces sp. PSKA30 TaxID=2874597 RepID=UPI001CD15EAE|nr:hypothetical protein [Streptomyces sp. PSKA30]MBZ9640243.1 hypothetical protein [Streptomyces sp. PSKA30]
MVLATHHFGLVNRGDVSMSYVLTVHSPWEGYRVCVNGSESRAELEVVEGGTVRANGTRLVVQRHGEEAQEVEVKEGEGGHGGGDALLLHDVFVGSGDDPLRRRAGSPVGSANRSDAVAECDAHARRPGDVGHPPRSGVAPA